MSLINEVTQLIGKPAGSMLECHPTFTRTPEQLAQTISAFASADGGFILLGVTKKGEVKGLGEGFWIENVLAEVPNHLEPTPQFIHELVSIQGKQVYVIKVFKSIKKVFVKGRSFIRKSDKTIDNTPQLEMNLPPFVVEALREQIKEQYEMILRYRELKNRALDKKKREKHQKEIDLCQQNIQEIQEGFLQDAKLQDGTLSTDHLLEFSQQMVIQIKQELDQQKMPDTATRPITNLKNRSVIFTGFANPHRDLIHLSQEQQNIQDALSPLEAQEKLRKHLQRNDLNLEGYFKDLRDWENQIHIFHFGGHANSQDIRLQDRSIFFKPLAQELKLRNPDSLQLVFLNGCATEAHVTTLFELDVKAVIATSVSVYDNLAALFARHFYKNLAQGDTISKAFESARHFAEAQQKANQKYRILAQPVTWKSRGSFKISQTDEQEQPFPWGLYLNDDEVQNYRLVV